MLKYNKVQIYKEKHTAKAACKHLILYAPESWPWPSEKLTKQLRIDRQLRQRTNFMLSKENSSLEKVTGELFHSLLL